MNSGMMPSPGIYSIQPITPEEYADAVKSAIDSGEWASSIGYPDNIRIIRELTGFEIPINREETELQPGDTMLIMRLRYRVQGYKNFPVSLGDFDFFRATFSAPGDRHRDFPSSLRAELSRQGMTQSDLANRLGVAPPRITEYMNGTQLPSLPTIQAIAQAIGVPVGALPEEWPDPPPCGVWL